jgi:hypothetical protein
MDKNKFWLGGRLFNTASPRLGAPTQHKARSQVGRPNARPQCKRKVNLLIRPHQGRAPQCNEKRVRKMGAQTQYKACLQVGRPNAMQGTSASRAPQRNATQFRKLGAPTHVRNANARHVCMSASWAPQRNARHVRKMVAQTQNSSAMKTCTKGSTRLKDELEDG